MNTNDEDLNNRELKLLKTKLPAILTLSQDDVIALMRKSPDQATTIAHALDALGETGNRQWLGHSMVSLPLENWMKHDDGLHSVTATRDASLRYLFQEIDEAAEEGAGHLESRKRLYDQLSSYWNDMPSRFQPMLKWTSLYQAYAINCDIALASTIDKVEVLFMKAYTKAEVHCRNVNLLSHAHEVPTPIMFIPRLAKQALSDTRDALEEMAKGTDEQLSKDHLVARLMCNVAANRVLLESARLGALAKMAADVNVKLIEALNSAGIVEVPDVGSDEEIERVLSRLFGKGGSMLGVGGMSRFLSGDDLATTIAAAKRVQVQYLGTRGKPSLSLHDSAHRTATDTLMFALALVGVFELSSKLDNEFRGKDGYAAFPGRGTPARWGLLRPHALELAKTMYSQMAFSNVGWGLRATHVHDYEQAMARKRACMQMLIFRVFKRWPAGKLCALHQAFSKAPHDIPVDQQQAPWSESA
jgi:hypothetical protein